MTVMMNRDCYEILWLPDIFALLKHPPSNVLYQKTIIVAAVITLYNYIDNIL